MSCILLGPYCYIHTVYWPEENLAQAKIWWGQRGPPSTNVSWFFEIVANFIVVVIFCVMETEVNQNINFLYTRFTSSFSISINAEDDQGLPDPSQPHPNPSVRPPSAPPFLFVVFCSFVCVCVCVCVNLTYYQHLKASTEYSMPNQWRLNGQWPSLLQMFLVSPSLLPEMFMICKAL